MAKLDRPLSKRAWARLAGLSVVGGGLAIFGSYAIERWSLSASQFGLEYGTGPIDPFIRFEMPGVDRPQIIPAGQSKLGPDEEILGVVVGGKARAYRLDAFRDRSRHVVNDEIDDVPISVTYCDLGNCVRGYLGQPGQGRLKLATAGLSEGRQLVLELGGSRYYQDSGRSFHPEAAETTLPLERLDPIRTTWERWKRDHPDTEVYEGMIRAARTNP